MDDPGKPLAHVLAVTAEQRLGILAVGRESTVKGNCRKHHSALVPLELWLSRENALKGGPCFVPNLLCSVFGHGVAKGFPKAPIKPLHIQRVHIFT